MPAKPDPELIAADEKTVLYRSGGTDTPLVPKNIQKDKEGDSTADLYHPEETVENEEGKIVPVLKVKGAKGAAEPTEGCFLDATMAKEKAEKDKAAEKAADKAADKAAKEEERERK